MSQLDRGRWLSPQRGHGHKALQSKRVFPREQVIQGPAHLGSEEGQRCGFAVFVFKFGKILFARLTLPKKEHGGFGKRPASMHGADLFAGSPQSFSA
jgi:hypothetical protein